MRLYHSRLGAGTNFSSIHDLWSGLSFKVLLSFLFLLIMGTAGCDLIPAVPLQAEEIAIVIAADGIDHEVKIRPGSSVHQALTAANISLGAFDRSEPPIFSILNEPGQVKVVRVREEFEIVEEIVPYQNQVLRNESMPEGETRLIQPGENGIQEITYRRVYEDDASISFSPVKVVSIKEPVPEIFMVGSHAPFASFHIPGRLVYLLGGNVWLIQGHTGNRQPVITSGDLDGRIFSLSPDGQWLLFTRYTEEEDAINHLWAARIPEDPGMDEVEFVDLNVTNVVHFADWKPGSTYTVAYSTVEPRPVAPGWQANNDLQMLHMNSSGQVRHLPVQLETNMGGTYGWWGMTFAWSPDGNKMAYARPDSVGLLEMGEESLTQLLEVVPLLTRGEWAWVPGLSWGSDGKILFTVDHVQGRGAISPEESPFYDLTAISFEGGGSMSLVATAGMFTYPVVSPFLSSGEKDYQVAYLQAIFPAQSETSRYQLAVMDRDGSNRRIIFPPEGAPGLTPQARWGAWSPEPLADTGSLAIALIYQDNLWVVDSAAGNARQITGDDLITRVDWKSYEP
jgi:resuscitation-promoting factor RpfB